MALPPDGTPSDSSSKRTLMSVSENLGLASRCGIFSLYGGPRSLDSPFVAPLV